MPVGVTQPGRLLGRFARPVRSPACRPSRDTTPRTVRSSPPATSSGRPRRGASDTFRGLPTCPSRGGTSEPGGSGPRIVLPGREAGPPNAFSKSCGKSVTGRAVKNSPGVPIVLRRESRWPDGVAGVGGAEQVGFRLFQFSPELPAILRMNLQSAIIASGRPFAAAPSSRFTAAATSPTWDLCRIGEAGETDARRSDARFKRPRQSPSPPSSGRALRLERPAPRERTARAGSPRTAASFTSLSAATIGSCHPDPDFVTPPEEEPSDPGRRLEAVRLPRPVAARSADAVVPRPFASRGERAHRPRVTECGVDFVPRELRLPALSGRLGAAGAGPAFRGPRRDPRRLPAAGPLPPASPARVEARAAAVAETPAVQVVLHRHFGIVFGTNTNMPSPGPTWPNCGVITPFVFSATPFATGA